MQANAYISKHIVITGATGLIGSNLVAWLLECPGVNITVLGRSISKLRAVFGSNPRLRMVEWNALNPLSRELGSVDYFFHAAGSVSGLDVRERPLSIVEANLNGTIAALNYLRRQQEESGVRGVFVVFSSATVYGYPVEESTCAEEQTTHSEAVDSVMAPYSESKRMVEVVARAYNRQFGMPIKIARFGYVYGPCPVPQNNAFYSFISKIGKGEDVVFRMTGLARRDNIFVEDAIEGLMCVCERGADGEAYNISSNGFGANYAAVDELVCEIAAAAKARGFTGKVSVGKSITRAPGLLMDNVKLKSLGWSPKTSLTDGVRKTCDYFWCREKKAKGVRS